MWKISTILFSLFSFQVYSNTECPNIAGKYKDKNSRKIIVIEQDIDNEGEYIRTKLLNGKFGPKLYLSANKRNLHQGKKIYYSVNCINDESIELFYSGENPREKVNFEVLKMLTLNSTGIDISYNFEFVYKDNTTRKNQREENYFLVE